MSAARMMNAGRQESRRGPEPPGTAPVGPPGRRAALRCRACLYLVLHLIERIVGPLGLRVDESSPWADARLPDGSRVQTNFLDAPLVADPTRRGTPLPSIQLGCPRSHARMSEIGLSRGSLRAQGAFRA